MSWQEVDGRWRWIDEEELGQAIKEFLVKIVQKETEDQLGKIGEAHRELANRHYETPIPPGTVEPRLRDGPRFWLDWWRNYPKAIRPPKSD